MGIDYNSFQMEEYLKILGIDKGLSLEEIQKIYKKKAMEYHPDRNHGFREEAEKKMKQINIAFDYIKKYYEFYISLNDTEKDFFDDEEIYNKEEETFEEIGSFYCGFAKVKKNGKWGFIDKNYSLIVNCIYDSVGNFSENLAGVKKNGKAGFINTFGVEKISLEYDWVEEFKNGYAKICKDGKEGKVDTYGKEYFEIKNNVSNNYKTEKSYDKMNKYEKLEYLANLNKKGILSNQEFEIEKNKLLGKESKKSEDKVEIKNKKQSTENEKPFTLWDRIVAIFGWIIIFGVFGRLIEWILELFK